MTEPQDELLRDVEAYAETFLASLAERRVGPRAAAAELRRRLGGPLQESSRDPREVFRELVETLEPGVAASTGPRYFGFVIGGSLPAALAADWVAALWDQNSFSATTSPAAAAAEEVAGAWIAELLGIPGGSSFGFVTGTQTAHLVALAAARDELLRRAGWDPEGGLAGAPPLDVIVGESRHVTVDRALRLLGIGRAHLRVAAVDEQGRIVPKAFAAELASARGSAIVCLQAGNVNTGSFDPFAELVPVARDHGAWVHVDGAFGLWAAASPQLAHLTAGHEGADSWATDAHKWLNVPYDSGLVYTARPDAHFAATRFHHAPYLESDEPQERDQADWTLESSRRARGFAVWAALRSLGRRGVAELVETSCAHARRVAGSLAATAGIEVLNDVVLNQVLLRVGDSDEVTKDVVRRVQEDGTCWVGRTEWRGRAAIRVSVSGWQTTTADIDRSVDAIRRAAGL